MYKRQDDVNPAAAMDITRVSRIGAGATGTDEIDLSAGIQTGFDADQSTDKLGDISLSVGADGSTRLAVGVSASDGYNNAKTDAGDVLLFTFNDAAGKDFSGGELAAVIGSGYDNDSYANPRSGKDLDLATPLEAQDQFGVAVSLDYDSTLGRHRLAVVARDDEGESNAAGSTETGAVYLFTFTDDSFSGADHVGTIGHSYDCLLYTSPSPRD